MTVRLMTRTYRTTPFATQEGFIVSTDDGAAVHVVEGRSFDADRDYRKPFGSDCTQFSSLQDATEYALRRGWTSSALRQWGTDLGFIPVA
jgi:hypothetical protein